MSARQPPGLLLRTLAVTFVTSVLLLVVIFVTVTMSAREQVRQTVSESLEASQRMFAAMHNREQHDLRRQAVTVAESPTLKAAMDTYAAESFSATRGARAAAEYDQRRARQAGRAGRSRRDRRRRRAADHAGGRGPVRQRLSAARADAGRKRPVERRRDRRRRTCRRRDVPPGRRAAASQRWHRNRHTLSGDEPRPAVRAAAGRHRAHATLRSSATGRWWRRHSRPTRSGSFPPSRRD